MRNSTTKRARAGQPTVALLCLAAGFLVLLPLFPLAADAQEEEPVPDIFSVNNTAREVPGSLDAAIAAAEAGDNVANTIRFQADLEFLTLRLESTPGSDPLLPAIAIDLGTTALGAERNVDLNATGIIDFEIEALSTTEVSTDFTLLHVESGQVTLVDLDLTAINDEGERVRAKLDVDSGATLGFRYSSDHTAKDNIVGAGSLVKEGEASLTLTGTNTYEGGTVVEEGNLQGHFTNSGDTVAASIQGDITVGLAPDGNEAQKNASLTFVDRSRTDVDAYNYRGEITGKGKVIKRGDHTLNFFDELDFSGRLAVEGGTEILEGGIHSDVDHISGDVFIGQGAHLQFFQTLAGEYAGALSGAGRLEKTGPGDLTLTGNNSFSGGVEIEAGRLIGDSESIPGNAELSSGTSLIFLQTAAGTHTGNISGAGKLVKSGSGTLTLAGTSTHTGDTVIREGTLRGDTRSLVGNIILTSALPADDPTVEFAVAGDETFDGTITSAAGSLEGTGDFVKSGAGSLTLAAGASLTHAGTTEITAGTLRLATDLLQTSSVTVESGAALENASATGQVTINGGLVSRGRVILGGVTDELHVQAGSVDLRSGAALAITLNDQGQSSKLIVDDPGSRATLDGIEIAVTALPGLYPEPDEQGPQTEYTVLSASGGVFDRGNGPAFTTPTYAFLEVDISPFVSGDPKLALTVTRNTNQVADFAQTPNQEATAPALEQLLASGSPGSDAEDIERSLSVLLPSQVPDVLDQMAGESLGAFTNPREANAYAFAQALSRRYTANEYRSGPVKRQAGAAGGGGPSAGGWLEPVGLFSSQSGGVNASTISANSGGLAAGFDAPLPGWTNARLGLGFGYTRHSLEGSRGLTGQGNTYQAAVYGSWEKKGYYAGLAGRYAFSNMETDRLIAFEDIDRRATARSSGQEAGFIVEAGARLGDITRIAYRPMVRLQYNHLSQDAFREEGAGDLSLLTDPASFDSWQTTVGARVSKLFTLDGEFGIEPEIRVGWTHDFGDLARPVVARFYSVPGAAPFVTAGAQADPDQLFVGTGYLMRIGEVPLVGLDYDFYTTDGYDLHVVSAQVYLRW